MVLKLNSPKTSLTLRLIFSAAVLMVLFLGFTGYALDRAFYNSQLAAQSERLFLRVFNLLSLSEMDDSSLTLPRILREPRFNSPESGLVALIVDDSRATVWESMSSEWFQETEWIRSLPNLDIGEEEFGLYHDWVYRRNAFLWEDPTGGDYYSEYWVLENAAPLHKAVQTFRSQLWGSLVAVTLLLLLALALVTAWSLRPLRLITQHLNRIRAGEAESLAGPYPRELSPLTDSLNQLLQAEKGQRERYRKALGDLAHSLKTPLAVMRTVARSDQPELNDQISRMDQIVRYQLQRAVTDARTGVVLGQRCDLAASLTRMGQALEKAFSQEDIVLDLPDMDHEIYVAMDSNDVLEVLGNLLENGFKYSRSVISVQLESNAKTLWLHVDDDGPGVSIEQRKNVLTRGKRLDTLQPGQGIGLAMVNDILDSYQLQLDISESPLGGARFSIELPLG